MGGKNRTLAKLGTSPFLMFLLPVFRPALIADFPSVNGKSRAEAEGVCNAAIDGNSVLQTCVQRVGLDFTGVKETCVEDYKVLLKNQVCFRFLSKFTKNPGHFHFHHLYHPDH